MLVMDLSLPDAETPAMPQRSVEYAVWDACAWRLRHHRQER